MLVVLLGRVCDEDHMYSGFAVMGGSEHKKEFSEDDCLAVHHERTEDDDLDILDLHKAMQ